MRGTILDFNDKEMIGLILGNDGNRYTFNVEADWQNKNKFPEIDSLVDFIINDNKATQIYSINNKNLELIETKDNKNLTNNMNFRKIDFKKLEDELNDENNLKKTKKELKNEFYISIGVFILIWIIVGFIDKNNEIIMLMMLIVIVPSFLAIGKTFFALFFSKDKLEEDIVEKLYKKDLSIISYVPEKLNYEVIELISFSDNTQEEAKKGLIIKAFRLKADGIINYKHDVIKSSYVSGKKGNVSTKVNTTHKVEGVAIRLI